MLEIENLDKKYKQYTDINWITITFVFCSAAALGFLSYYYSSDDCSTLIFFQRSSNDLDQKITSALIFEGIIGHFIYFALVRDFLEARNDGKFLHFRNWLGTYYSIAGIFLQYMKARIRVLLFYPIVLFSFVYTTFGLFDCLLN